MLLKKDGFIRFIQMMSFISIMDILISKTSIIFICPMHQTPMLLHSLLELGPKVAMFLESLMIWIQFILSNQMVKKYQELQGGD